VIRWEKNETLIKTEKEKFFTENLGIPHQVMRNLNTDNPILVFHDHSGFYAGHITILPLKYKTYLDIRNHEMREKDIRTVDLTNDLTERPLVFYFYSLYADAADNAYYLLNRMFTHFKKNKYDDYIFAGISGRRKKIELLCEMGLKVVWEKKIEEDSDDIFTFLEGNFDNYLFKS
jgi:hypothetical protein